MDKPEFKVLGVRKTAAADPWRTCFKENELCGLG